MKYEVLYSEINLVNCCRLEFHRSSLRKEDKQKVSGVKLLA